MARAESEAKALRDGYYFHSYEYDGDAQDMRAKLEGIGYDVRLLRERSDTAGLKMYSVWKREA